MRKIEILSKVITEYFLNHQLIDKDDEAMCYYALYRRLSRLAVGGLMILIGSIEVGFCASCCFTVGFLFLRERIGGYHAPNETVCVVMSCMVEFIALEFIPMFLKVPISGWLLVIGSGICIILIAPVNNENIHMTAAEIKQNAFCARLRLAILILIIVLLYKIGASQAAIALQLAIFAGTSSMVVANCRMYIFNKEAIK